MYSALNLQPRNFIRLHFIHAKPRKYVAGVHLHVIAEI